MDEHDPQQPIGAPELPPVLSEHCVRSPTGFDVARLILGHAANNETVELVSLTERRRWCGLRQEVRFVVRGSAWDVARFWDDVREGLPRSGGFSPFDLLDSWW
jgi:hypothetical protein